MSIKTLLAISKGRWLMDKSYAEAMLPLVFRMMQGEPVDFGLEKEVNTDPVKISTKVASAYAVNSYSDITKLPEGSIAVVPIKGPVLKYGDYCSWGMVEQAALVSRLANAGNITGIVMDVDSPGGEAYGTATLGDAIIRAKQRKPVLTSIDDGIAASAGAWIALASTEVYVSQPTDQVGSIGVYTTIADWNKHYADYYKLPVKDVYAPQSTDKNKAWMDALEGKEDDLKAELKVIASRFIATVKANRAGKLTSDEWATGKMYYASDAKKLGLIDGVKSFDQVLQRITELT